MTEQEFTGWLNSISFTNKEVGVERCKAQVSMGWRSRQCERNAVKDGWCKQHHPDSVKARQQASAQHYEEKKKQSAWYLLMKAKERIRELEAENARLKIAAAITLKLAEDRSRPDDAK